MRRAAMLPCPCPSSGASRHERRDASRPTSDAPILLRPQRRERERHGVEGRDGEGVVRGGVAMTTLSLICATARSRSLLERGLSALKTGSPLSLSLVVACRQYSGRGEAIQPASSPGVSDAGTSGWQRRRIGARTGAGSRPEGHHRRERTDPRLPGPADHARPTPTIRPADPRVSSDEGCAKSFDRESSFDRE